MCKYVVYKNLKNYMHKVVELLFYNERARKILSCFFFRTKCFCLTFVKRLHTFMPLKEI